MFEIFNSDTFMLMKKNEWDRKKREELNKLAEKFGLGE